MNATRSKLLAKEGADLKAVIADIVLTSVLRGIPLSDICRLQEGETPDWVRGSVALINTITERLGGHLPASLTPIVLQKLPELEWMAENLTGHGGTEIDGQWYYTYDQAVEAVKQLGDGWRLPTAAEFEALVDLGSTWVDKGPGGVAGRWFGGNHAGDHAGSLFLPACGWRDRHNGEHKGFGGGGNYWSFTPESGSPRVNNMEFTANFVRPNQIDHRTYSFSVRLVRDLR